MVGAFDIYKSTGVIDGFDGQNINISGEHGWPNRLIITNCPNLKSVDCSDLIGINKLEILSISDCPNLEFLNASNNDINIIDLEIGNDKLETINLNANKLTSFNTSGLSNLKDLNVGGNKLTSLDLPDCDNLENLKANHNKLKELDLADLVELKTVYVPCNELKKIELSNCEDLWLLNISNNQIKNLRLRDLKNLKFFNCSYNFLKKLEVKHLEKIKSLSCEGCALKELDCSDLEYLEYLACFNNGYVGKEIKEDVWKKFTTEKVWENVKLEELNIDNCKNLEFLDCAENNIERLFINNHSKLWNVSCKTNKLNNLLVLDCPNLKLLDFSMQGERVIIKKKAIFKNSISTYATIGICPNLERVKYTKGTNFSLLKEGEVSDFNWEEDFKYFPKLTDFGVGNIADDPAFEEYLDKKRKEEWERDNLRQPEEDESDEKNSDLPKPTISPCNYKIPTDKEKFEEHDLSQRHLTGKLIIEDWPNLKFLNLGDNCLQALVVKNCPKLRKLIYAHNAMPNEAEIYDCNITEIDNYLYDEFVGKEDEPISEEEQAYIEEQERRERQREDEGYESEEDDKINHDITLEYLESLTYEELSNLDPESVPRDLAINVISLLKKKFIEQIKQQEQEEKALQKVAGLIVEAQQALKENNLSKLKIILDEMKNYCDTDAYANNKELIAKLEQQLINATSQLETNNKTPNLPLIIGLSLVSIGILVLLLKFLQNKLKKMLKFR